MAKDPIDFRDCRNCTCSALRRATRVVTHHYDQIMRGSGLRSTQFTMLATLMQTGPMAMTPMAALLGLERTTLTRNLKPLAREGLVELREERDGRVRKVAITAKGETVARDVFPLWKKAQKSAKALIASLDLSA
jgi:DNA-binding MarR family transcriptional regulator